MSGLDVNDKIKENIGAANTSDEILKVYRYYINSNKIDKFFLEELKTFKQQMEKIITFNSEKQLLIKSVYRLNRKIEKENKEFYEKKYFKEYKEYFSEFETRYDIREEKKFKLKRKNQLKRIDIFKKYMLSDEKYRRLIKQISKNSMCVDDYIMFDFVFYVQKTLKDKNFIVENDRRFSYEFFCKNNFDQVMLNELFTPFGFSLIKNESIFDKTIGFDELIKSSYISNPEEQTKIFNKYKYHPSQIYLYYTFSQNPLLNEEIAKNILNNMDELYTYPYSSDIATIIGVIKGNISKIFFNLKKKDVIVPIKLYDFNIHRDELFNEFTYVKLDELAYFISYKKNISNIKDYFEAINEYWKELKKVKNRIQDFTNFKSYIKTLIENDYLILFFEEFYVNKLKSLEEKSIDTYNDNLNKEFLSIKEIKEIKESIINDEQCVEDENFINFIRELETFFREKNKEDINNKFKEIIDKDNSEAFLYFILNSKYLELLDEKILFYLEMYIYDKNELKDFVKIKYPDMFNISKKLLDGTFISFLRLAKYEAIQRISKDFDLEKEIIVEDLKNATKYLEVEKDNDIFRILDIKEIKEKDILNKNILIFLFEEKIENKIIPFHKDIKKSINDLNKQYKDLKLFEINFQE